MVGPLTSSHGHLCFIIIIYDMYMWTSGLSTCMLVQGSGHFTLSTARVCCSPRTPGLGLPPYTLQCLASCVTWSRGGQWERAIKLYPPPPPPTPSRHRGGHNGLNTPLRLNFNIKYYTPWGAVAQVVEHWTMTPRRLGSDHFIIWGGGWKSFWKNNLALLLAKKNNLAQPVCWKNFFALICCKKNNLASTLKIMWISLTIKK